MRVQSKVEGEAEVVDALSPAGLLTDAQQQIADAVRQILIAIGEDPEREGLRDTPLRVARMMGELFSGLDQDPSEHLAVQFHQDYEGVVQVRDIPFYTMCEHHLLPFFGRAAVAYQPDHGVITGLSKLARLVEGVARRPQVQERMTQEVADALERRLHPKGVLVRLEAEHLCMSMRGVQKPGTKTVTMVATGTLAPSTPLYRSLMDQWR